MRPRAGHKRVIKAALAILCGLGASGSAADDAAPGELGPIRQWVEHTGAVRGNSDVRIGPVTALRAPPPGRNHGTQGAIAGAVVLGVLGGYYFGAMGAFACDGDPDKCDDAVWLAAAGAAGGALVGGAVGALIGSQFELNPTIPPASGPRTRVRLLPRRGGVGIAVSHSF